VTLGPVQCSGEAISSYSAIFAGTGRNEKMSTAGASPLATQSTDAVESGTAVSHTERSRVMTTTTTTLAAPPAASAAPAGKPEQRGRKPGQKVRTYDYTGLDAAFLTQPAPVTGELTSLAAPVRARDDRQVAIDKIVRDLHERWESNGRPDRWAEMPKVSYVVSPVAADTLRMLVRRAAQFHGVSAKFGKPVRNKDGREIVVFAIRDLRTRAKTQSTWTFSELADYVTEYFDGEPEAANDFLAGLTNELPDE
jgi:hypothetical protein